MRFSSSLRVTLMSELKPGSSAGTTVAVSADSRSLACRASSRSRASDPSPSVPVVIGVVGVGDSGDHMVEQGLVDLVAGEVGIADRLADLGEVRAGVGQRDAGSATAQVHQRDDAARRQPRCGLQRGERRDRIRDERRGHTVRREARLCAQRAPQRTDGSGAPVRGHGDRDGGAAADRACHRVEGLDEHSLADMWGAVGGHQRNRVADPLDETAQHEAGLVEFGFSSMARRLRAARSLNSVRTERRMTGGRPIRAATRFVIPIDNPSESLMFPSLVGPEFGRCSR